MLLPCTKQFCPLVYLLACIIPYRNGFNLMNRCDTAHKSGNHADPETNPKTSPSTPSFLCWLVRKGHIIPSEKKKNTTVNVIFFPLFIFICYSAAYWQRSTEFEENWLAANLPWTLRTICFWNESSFPSQIHPSVCSKEWKKESERESKRERERAQRVRKRKWEKEEKSALIHKRRTNTENFSL